MRLYPRVRMTEGELDRKQVSKDMMNLSGKKGQKVILVILVILLVVAMVIPLMASYFSSL